jgi:hypothetical protein
MACLPGDTKAIPVNAPLIGAAMAGFNVAHLGGHGLWPAGPVIGGVLPPLWHQGRKGQPMPRISRGGNHKKADPVAIPARAPARMRQQREGKPKPPAWRPLDVSGGAAPAPRSVLGERPSDRLCYLSNRSNARPRAALHSLASSVPSLSRSAALKRDLHCCFNELTVVWLR